MLFVLESWSLSINSCHFSLSPRRLSRSNIYKGNSCENSLPCTFFRCQKQTNIVLILCLVLEVSILGLTRTYIKELAVKTVNLIYPCSMRYLTIGDKCIHSLLHPKYFDIRIKQTLFRFSSFNLRCGGMTMSPPLTILFWSWVWYSLVPTSA